MTNSLPHKDCGKNYHKDCSVKASPHCDKGVRMQKPKYPLVRVSTLTRNESDKLYSLWYGLMKYSFGTSAEVSL